MKAVTWSATGGFRAVSLSSPCICVPATTSFTIQQFSECRIGQTHSAIQTKKALIPDGGFCDFFGRDDRDTRKVLFPDARHNVIIVLAGIKPTPQGLQEESQIFFGQALMQGQFSNAVRVQLKCKAFPAAILFRLIDHTLFAQERRSLDEEGEFGIGDQMRGEFFEQLMREFLSNWVGGAVCSIRLCGFVQQLQDTLDGDDLRIFGASCCNSSCKHLLRRRDVRGHKSKTYREIRYSSRKSPFFAMVR